MTVHPEWSMAIGGHQVGPVSAEEIIANLRNGTIDIATLVFKQGMSAWTPIRDVPEFRDQAATSLPLSRLADRIYKAAPQRRGGRSEEGGILDHLGGLGNVIDGD